MDQDDDDETRPYENVKDYLANIDHDDGDEGAEEGGEVYYNVPDTGNRNIEDLEEDSDLYVYMKSGHNIDMDSEDTPTDMPTQSATAAVETDRKRLQSEPLGKVKKYVNVSSEQKSRSQHPRSVGSRAAVSIKPAPAGGSIGKQDRPKSAKDKGLVESEDQQPIYANCQEDEGAEDEEEELYTEVA